MLKPCYTPHLIEAGVDEVGRGCLAGPVVAAAVILPKDFSHPFLNDSKQLSLEQRMAAAEYVREHALTWAIAEASHEEIDQINILQASFLAMHRALEQVCQLHAAPELILVDGNRFRPYNFIPHLCVVKGDAEYAAIAAASVLAKVHRDALMEQLAGHHPHYGWETNVGYPTPHHRRALKQHGPTPHHRLTFLRKLFAESAAEAETAALMPEAAQEMQG